VSEPADRLDSSPRFVRWARLCFALAAVAILSTCLRNTAVLVDKPFTEDGFYLLAVARNLGIGHGLTIDGTRLTNGIQPLFAFLAAPAYWFADGDRIAGLRGVMLLHSLFFVGAAWLFGLVLRDAVRGSERLRWIGSLSWLGSGYLFTLSHNGLETGLLLFCYLAYWRLWQRRPLGGVGIATVHGTMLGVLVLARIDATFFVTALLAWHVLRGDGPLRTRLRDAIVTGAVAVLVSSPWWIFNYVNFGALMPTSGTAQSGDYGGAVRDLVASRTFAAARNVLLVATPVLFGGDGAGGLKVLLIRGLFLLTVLVVLFRVPAVPRSLPRSSNPGRPVAIALLTAGGVLVVYYAAFFWATHFYNRYYILLAPFGMAMWAIAVDRVVARSVVVGRLLAPALATAAAGLALIAHTGILFAGNEWLHEQVALVQKYVPPGERVAAGQTGTLGYFVDSVHNLDGKVNAEALHHQHSMREYLAKYDIEWLCDWREEYLYRYVDPAELRSEWDRVDVPPDPATHRGPVFELWHRRSHRPH